MVKLESTIMGQMDRKDMEKLPLPKFSGSPQPTLSLVENKFNFVSAKFRQE